MPHKSRWKARFPLVLGYLSLTLLVGVLGYWGTTARIAGAVIASGMIQVESNRQVVQHPDGGVVGQINVKDGDRVQAGDILLRLDDTFLQSELSIIESRLFEMMARKARLEAERDGQEDYAMPPHIAALAEDHADMGPLFAGQRDLFMARRDTKHAELEQISEQRGQVEDQITGSTAELAALNEQLELISQEHVDGETLLQSTLTQTPKTLILQREAASLKGQIGRLQAAIAQLEGQITALNMKELSLDTIRREEAIAHLRDLEPQISETAQRRLTLLEQMSRLDIRAPVSGTIFGSTLFTIKAVIQPAAPLMYVVPQDQPLVVSAHIDSIHVDQVYMNQEASLRFSALDQRRTPEIRGVVSKLSADAIIDEATGATFYQVELIPLADDLPKLRGQSLLPGMPVEAYIKTSDRSPINYLTKPLMDYFNAAFREE